MPVSIKRSNNVTFDGEFQYRELGNIKVMSFEVEEMNEAEAFARAALWLKDNPGFTVISVAFDYIFEETSVQLLLTVE